MGDELLGVLAISAGQAGSLDQGDQLLIESLQATVALAIADVSYRQEVEGRLRQLNALQRMLTRQNWQPLGSQRDKADGFVYDEQAVRPIQEGNLIGSGESSSLLKSDGTDHRTYVTPLSVSGEAIGALGVRQDPDRPLAPREQELLRAIAEQVTEALQRAQLLERSGSQAMRERMIRDIADKMQRATDMRSLLRIAAEELTRALGASRAYVHMGSEEELLHGAEP
jgi:GAF domain-containing protein